MNYPVILLAAGIFLEVPVHLIVMLVILAALIGAIVALYFIGKKAEKKQAEQEEQLAQYKQTISMLVIDKKRLKLQDSGLPAMVTEQMPWYGRFQKLPIVKAKVGPKVMSLICDDKIFDDVPVKKEVKAVVSGIYIMEVKGLHGKNRTAAQAPKKGFRAWVEKLQEKAGAKPVK